jgi:hypothetical protein
MRPNKAMQVSKTARCSFDILLSHKVWVVQHGSLPVAMARFFHLMAGVSVANATLLDRGRNY